MSYERQHNMVSISEQVIEKYCTQQDMCTQRNPLKTQQTVFVFQYAHHVLDTNIVYVICFQLYLLYNSE